MARRNRMVGVVAGLLLFFATGCGGSDGGGSGDGGTPVEGAVAGTLAFPSEVTDVCAMIALDTDSSGSNGVAMRDDGSEIGSLQLVSGSSVDFLLEEVPAGEYFLWAYVDADASVSNPPDDCNIAGGPAAGDFLGWYDEGLAEPTVANVSVPHAQGAVFDFPLGVVP